MPVSSEKLVLSVIAAGIVASSLIAGIVLLPALGGPSESTSIFSTVVSEYASSTSFNSSSPSSTSESSNNQTMDVQVSPVTSLTFNQTSSSSLQLGSTVNARSLMTNSTTNSSGSGIVSEGAGMGGPNWQVYENFTISNPLSGAINCGVLGEPGEGLEETHCNMQFSNNSSDTTPAADFGLQVVGGGSQWAYNLGITHGVGQPSYVWYFGDGTNTTGVSNQTIDHTYNQSGFYETTVNVLITSPRNQSAWKVYVQISIFVDATFGGSSSPNGNLVLLTPESGSSTCASLFVGVVGTGGWNSTTNTCTLSGNPITSPTFLMDRGMTIEIAKNVTLVLTNPAYGFSNYGTVVNNGTIILQNSFIDYGTLINNGQILNYNVNFIIESAPASNDSGFFSNLGLLENAPWAGISNGGIIENNGTITNAENATIYNFLDTYNYTSTINNFGTVENHGTVQNEYQIYNIGTFENQGIVIDICRGSFSGDPVRGNAVSAQACSN